MPRFHVRPTSHLHGPLQLAKRVAYRTPWLRNFTKPVYPLLIDPLAAAEMVVAIDRTRELGGSIVEIGVARGMTTVFLNEHMKRTGDTRRYLCIDTFSGFTHEDVAFEVAKRGKDGRHYGAFAYNDAAVFRRNLSAYNNVEVIQRDVCKVTAADVGPVAVALVDVDLYRPVMHSLSILYENLISGGEIVVDDVCEAPLYDGAHAAYIEFCQQHRIDRMCLSAKTAVIAA